MLTPPGVGALAARLGSRVLVELVAHGDRLRAVLVRDGRASLHDLGPLAEAVRLARRHRFALRRLVTTGDTAAARAGAGARRSRPGPPALRPAAAAPRPTAPW